MSQTVHPRVRGERGDGWTYRGRGLGSSPRARGTHRHDARQPTPHRFIPACAGNAKARFRRQLPSAVHPRVRGERTAGMPVKRHGAGSSPRARGTPVIDRFGRAGIRFIPACAGNAGLGA